MLHPALDDIRCIIFDLDGTLVDSEVLAARVFLELVPEVQMPVDEATERFKGRHLPLILEDLENLSKRKLPDNFVDLYRARMAKLYQTDLMVFEGVTDLLKQLDIDFCIASSGPPQKIENALNATGLNQYFEDRYFSSYLIQSWKPEPDIFLYAARHFRHSPQNCLVVEDSKPGILAARAAGMHSILISEDDLGLSDQITRPNFLETAKLLGLK